MRLECQIKDNISKIMKTYEKLFGTLKDLQCSVYVQKIYEKLERFLCNRVVFVPL